MKLRKLRFRNKKGITPIIAVILLMMMTVAAAGAAFFWFVRIQSELQGGSDSHANQLSETINSKIEVLVTDLQGSSLNVYLKNVGGTDVPVKSGSTSPTTTFLMQESSGKVICQTYLDSSHASCVAGCGNSIDVGELQAVTMTLASDCSLSSYSNTTKFAYTLDFSGIASTGGEFEK